MPRSAISNRYLLLANLYNFRKENTSNWRTARNNVLNGSANARILYIGDSVILGVGSGTTNAAFTSGEIKSGSAPTRVAALMNSYGINTHANSFCGSGAAISSSSWPTIFSSTTDPRLVVGSSWSPHNSATLGGAYTKATTSTNALSFTPTVNVDTFDIWVACSTAGGFGTIQADINGGTATQFNTATGGASVTVQKFTVTGTLGSNTCNIKYVTGGTVYFVAISARDSSKKWVDVMNCGWSGGVWAGAGNTPMSNAGAVVALTGISPNLTILQGGINDWVGNTGTVSYKTNLQTMITTAKGLGSDVIISTDNPSITTSASTAQQLSYIQTMYDLATNNNIPLMDLWLRWGSYTAADGLGYYFHDNTGNNLHPNNMGFADIASAMKNILIR